MLASFCELFIAFRFFIPLTFTIACDCSFCCEFAFCKLIVFLSLCAFACEFSINALSELNMYCVFLFADVSDFCWLQNRLIMSFCSCLLVDKLMLSSSHKSVSISNVDFLISIVNVLSSDSELLLLLSFALLFAKSTYQMIEYWDYWLSNQYQKCQTFKHLQNKCNESSRCLFCERNYLTWKHKCQLSTCEDKQSCNHMIFKCCNCQNVHFANNIMCKTYQTAQSINLQKDYLVTKL